MSILVILQVHFLLLLNRCYAIMVNSFRSGNFVSRAGIWSRLLSCSVWIFIPISLPSHNKEPVGVSEVWCVQQRGWVHGLSIRWVWLCTSDSSLFVPCFFTAAILGSFSLVLSSPLRTVTGERDNGYPSPIERDQWIWYAKHREITEPYCSQGAHAILRKWSISDFTHKKICLSTLHNIFFQKHCTAFLLSDSIERRSIYTPLSLHFIKAHADVRESLHGTLPRHRVQHARPFCIDQLCHINLYWVITRSFRSTLSTTVVAFSYRPSFLSSRLANSTCQAPVSFVRKLSLSHVPLYFFGAGTDQDTLDFSK